MKPPKTPRKTSSSAAPPPAVVGETPIARDFFAGQYAKVVAETFDDASADIRDEDVAFTIGALTFLGRVPDAVTCFEGWKRRGARRDPRTLAASRFFLGLAHARSGDFQRAHDHLVAGARERVRASDQWAAAFAFQGLACHRYFTGKYRSAARHALRALRAAHVARFAYAQMLSTDLRGHSLVQLGQYQAGVALLEQAKSYAERLGFGMNAHAIECSIVIYQATFKTGPEAIVDLESLLARRSHDSYSRRALLTQAAMQYALRGRGAEAARAIEQVDRDALRMDARRAKVTSLIARLYVTRWGLGAKACADLLDEAAAFLDESDVGFRAELYAFEAYVGQALGDARRLEHAIRNLRRLSRHAEHHVARAALEQFEGDRPRAFAEDELTPLLRACVQREERELPRLLALGLLGPLPEVLGLAPDRRVILLSTENAVIVQDHGDLWLRRSPPRWVPPLLRLLSSGDASKEALVAGLWGLRRYFPDRHDSLVRTTIHRLRTFLDPRGEWVTVTPSGYGLAVPVHEVGAGPHEALEAPLPEDDPLDEPGAGVGAPTSYGATSGTACPQWRPAPRAFSVRRAQTPPGDAAPAPREPSKVHAEALLPGSPDARVLDHLREVGEQSVPALVRALGLSESTALRALRRLVRAKRARRKGAARATRYEAR